MPREIKFRAWEYTSLDHSSGTIVEWETLNKYIESAFREFYRGELEIMQFTGLKDKNGKEIYCSDLIKTPAGIGEVTWEGGCYRIYWNHRDNTTLHDTKPEKMEIIGNIYENPELLERGE